jgi:nucleoside-diphosphate-sugar epimerase
MHVFVTGATGFVGSATVGALIAGGHSVLGLARSDAGAAALTAAGAQVHLGTLEDLDSLRRGAALAEGVIHTAFIHGFSDYAEFVANCEIDRLAIEAMGEAMAGTDRPLVVTSGTAMLAPPGGLATEDTVVPPGAPMPRVSEATGVALAARGVRGMAVRLPPSVHGAGDHGFVPTLIGVAREKGVSAYIGDGSNRWSSVHRLDAAQAYRLILEKGVAGTRYHAIDEEGVPFRAIAEAVGKGLGVPVVSLTPEQAAEHFGFFAMFAGMHAAASSAKTREALGWRPMQARLLEDMAAHYFGG